MARLLMFVPRSLISTLLFALVVASSPTVVAQGRATAAAIMPLIIHVEPNVDLEPLEIRYVLSDAAANSAGEIHGQPNVRDYPVAAVVDGRPARQIRGSAYLPGYGYGLIASTLAADDVARILTLRLDRLGTVRIAGHVSVPSAEGNESPSSAGTSGPLKVLVSYVPTWQCEFFGIIECVVDSRLLATATVTSSGEFGVDVPDFARDPALSAFRHKGEIELVPFRPGQSVPLGRAPVRLPVDAPTGTVTLSLDPPR